MDGRGRWMDNVFIERLWRSLKYECVYLNSFETGSELRTGFPDGFHIITTSARSRHWLGEPRLKPMAGAMLLTMGVMTPMVRSSHWRHERYPGVA
jgi:transposase InsO family protein